MRYSKHIKNVSENTKRNISSDIECCNKYDIDDLTVPDLISLLTDFPVLFDAWNLKLFETFAHRSYKECAAVISRFPQLFILLQLNHRCFTVWRSLLYSKPLLLNYVDTSKLNSLHCVWLLKTHPFLVNYIDTTCMESWEWVTVIIEHPHLIHSCRLLQEFSSYEWLTLLLCYPQLYNLYKSESKQMLSGNEWAQLLCKHPYLYTYCDFSVFNAEDWATLLTERTQFCRICDFGVLSKLQKTAESLRLISEHPGYVRYLNMTELEGSDLFYILRKRPELYIYCDMTKIGRFASDLCRAQPDFNEILERTNK